MARRMMPIWMDLQWRYLYPLSLRSSLFMSMTLCEFRPTTPSTLILSVTLATSSSIPLEKNINIIIIEYNGAHAPCVNGKAWIHIASCFIKVKCQIFLCIILYYYGSYCSYSLALILNLCIGTYDIQSCFQLCSLTLSNTVNFYKVITEHYM